MPSKNSRADIYVGLVHWPVVDRAGSTVCTNVTNFDIHDIARACRTYGVKKYFIINRMQEQLITVSRILAHWNVGQGRKLNPMRRTALGMVELAETVEVAMAKIKEEAGGLNAPHSDPYVVTTAARDFAQFEAVGFGQLQERMVEQPERPIFLLFGTGFGLHDDVLAQAHGLLPPIKGASEDDYRHLSVRSAVSIILDRLLGA